MFILLGNRVYFNTSLGCFFLKAYILLDLRMRIVSLKFRQEEQHKHITDVKRKKTT